MKAFGWGISVSRATQLEEWRTNRNGSGPVTYYDAQLDQQTVTLQVAQDDGDLETWVTLISIHPVRANLEALVKRRAQVWKPSLRGDGMLFSPIRFAYMEDTWVHLRDVTDQEELEAQGHCLGSFCTTQQVELALHEELDPGGSSPRWFGRICAVVPADSYELMAALFIGQRVAPLA